jgi:hypothetical protein
MKLQQRLFLTRSTLPLLNELLDRLDTLPEALERMAFPFFYCGFANRMEDERLTQEQLDSLPERVHKLLRFDWRNWRTERGWVNAVLEEGKVLDRVSLKLILNDDNIQRFESMTCDEIVMELETATREEYAAIPSRLELCEKYADPTNEKVYMFRWDVESLWVDRYLKDNSLVFKRHLTHFGR